jgi:hypothetical protein
MRQPRSAQNFWRVRIRFWNVIAATFYRKGRGRVDRDAPFAIVPGRFSRRAGS